MGERRRGSLDAEGEIDQTCRWDAVAASLSKQRRIRSDQIGKE